MTLQFDPQRPAELLWSGGYDRTIRLWDIGGAGNRVGTVPATAGSCLRVFSGHSGVVFGLVVCAHVLVSSSRDGSVRVWARDGPGAEGHCLRVLEANRSSSELTAAIR